MRTLWRAWTKLQARRDTGFGYFLYEVGQTTAGRPVRVDSGAWARAQEDPAYRDRLLRQVESLDMERR